MKVALIVIIGMLAACRSTIGPYSTLTEASCYTTAAERLNCEVATGLVRSRQRRKRSCAML